MLGRGRCDEIDLGGFRKIGVPGKIADLLGTPLRAVDRGPEDELRYRRKQHGSE